MAMFMMSRSRALPSRRALVTCGLLALALVWGLAGLASAKDAPAPGDGPSVRVQVDGKDVDVQPVIIQKDGGVFFQLNVNDADAAEPELKMVQSVSQYGITWTFDKEVPVGRFVTGDYYVVGPVTVTKIDPAPTGEGKELRHGSMLNPPTDTAQSYDGSIRAFSAEKLARAPLAMKPGDSLVSSISLETTQQNTNPADSTTPKEESLIRTKQQNTILANPTKPKEESPIRTLAVLTCLERPVPPDAFRPSYCDLAKTKIRLARNIRWEKLPTVKSVEAAMPEPWLSRYHKGAFTAEGRPTFDWLTRAFQRPWIDHIYGWDSRSMHAVESMPGYGREVGRMVSYAALALCSDLPKEQKERLAKQLIQVGIDNWGVATRSKRGSSGGWPAAGGFGNGRKLPIVFAAVLLNDEEMLQIRKNAPECSFGEDEHTEFGPSWTGAKVRFTGQYPLIGDRQIDRGPYEHLTPDQWPGRNKTMSESYRRCCTSNCWVGEALAVRLIGAEKVWDHDAFFAYVDRWMYQDDTESMKEIQKVYKDYDGIRQGSTHFDPWIDAMWKAYRTTLAAPTDTWK